VIPTGYYIIISPNYGFLVKFVFDKNKCLSRTYIILEVTTTKHGRRYVRQKFVLRWQRHNHRHDIKKYVYVYDHNISKIDLSMETISWKKYLYIGLIETLWVVYVVEKYIN